MRTPSKKPGRRTCALAAALLLALAPAAGRAATPTPALAPAGSGPTLPHCLAVSPLKPAFGLLLLEYEYAPAARLSFGASVDYVFSRFLVDRTVGRLYAAGEAHPDLVVRLGARYWPFAKGRPFPAGPLVGGSVGYVGSLRAPRPSHEPGATLEAGWRFAFARRFTATPRLLLSTRLDLWSPRTGVELLIGLHL